MQEKNAITQIERDSCRSKSVTFGIDPPPDSAYYSKLEPIPKWNQLKGAIGARLGQVVDRLGQVMNSVHGGGGVKGGSVGGAAPAPVLPAGRVFVP